MPLPVAGATLSPTRFHSEDPCPPSPRAGSVDTGLPSSPGSSGSGLHAGNPRSKPVLQGSGANANPHSSQNGSVALRRPVSAGRAGSSGEADPPPSLHPSCRLKLSTCSRHCLHRPLSCKGRPWEEGGLGTPGQCSAGLARPDPDGVTVRAARCLGVKQPVCCIWGGVAPRGQPPSSHGSGGETAGAGTEPAAFQNRNDCPHPSSTPSGRCRVKGGGVGGGRGAWAPRTESPLPSACYALQQLPAFKRLQKSSHGHGEFPEGSCCANEWNMFKYGRTCAGILIKLC